MTEPMTPTKTADTAASALWLPWIPVALPSGEQTTVGLADLFYRGHEITGLGAPLTPLDRDTLMRFLPTVAALVLREIDDEEDRLDVGETGHFPTDAVTAFTQRHHDDFFLAHPDRPFLQRWDLHRSDLDTLASELASKPAPKRKALTHEDPKKSILKPLGQLHPHAPGGSSARWAIRRDPRDPATDLAALTLLLAVTWWQTRRGNGQGHDGRPLQYGNPGQAGVRPMSVFWVGDNLGRTICANTPASWVADGNDELPMWLDQSRTPDAEELAGNPESLWRTSYARNLPFVYFDDALRPVGYVLGPTTYPVPPLATDEKTSLTDLHAFDYARLFKDVTSKGKPAEREQISALSARLSSTEGYTRWYHDRLNDALRSWGTGRILNPTDEPGWSYGVYGEICHPAGSREWSDWAVLPRAALSPDPAVAVELATLLKVIEKIRSAMYAPLRIACEGRSSKREAGPALLETIQTAFYAEAEEPLSRVLARVVDGNPVQWADAADELRRIGSRVFHAGTECVTAPTTLPQVWMARHRFDAKARAVVTRIYPPAEKGIAS
jgi:hypothetical protein